MKNIKYIAVAFLCSGLMTAQKINLDAMPKSGPTPKVHITQPKTFQMPNGMTVMVVENHKLPVVDISLRMDRPPVKEGDIAGVSGLMASQLGEGTQTVSKDDFNKKVDFYGADLSFYSRGASANTLSKYFPQILGMMADAALHPKFTQVELDKDKERTLENLKSNDKNVNQIASRVSSALIYGKNSAVGEFTTPESVKKITLKDIESYYKKYYAPDNSYLVIVGDVKFDEVKRLVEQNFGSWQKSDAEYLPVIPAQNVGSTEINVADVPSAVQSVIQIGNVSPLKMRDPQYFASRIANYILGGGAEARLFMNLREKHGFTYGAYSSLSTSKYSPYFKAYASVRNEVTAPAVEAFMEELKGVSKITPKELENAKAKLKGSFIMSLEDPATIADFAYTAKVQSLPEDFYTNYLKSIDNVTIAQAQKVVNEFILPSQSRIFIAGKASEIAESLGKLGYPVKYYDKYANEIAKPEAKQVAQGVTLATVGDSYLKAIGGRDKVAKITSMTAKAEGTVQGMKINVITENANGGKMMMDTQMMGRSLSKVVFDGKDGYVMVQGNKVPLPEDAKKEMMKNTSVVPELNFGTSKDYVLSGVENMNGEDCYVVKSGKTTLYYSVKTGLKVAQILVQKNIAGQEASVPTSYSDYKPVDGILVPFKFVTNMGGMDITFDVTSYEFNKAKDTDFK